MYCMGRSPLPINSNYYCLDQNWHPTYDQASRYCHYQLLLVVDFLFSVVTDILWHSVSWERCKLATQLLAEILSLYRNSCICFGVCVQIHLLLFTISGQNSQAPVQRIDCAILKINYYHVEKCEQNKACYSVFTAWIIIYLVESFIHLLNSLGPELKACLIFFAVAHCFNFLDPDSDFQK